MNKSERRLRRDAVNNFYIPPPARNRTQDGPECLVSVPPKKLDRSENYKSNDLKTKDRSLDVRLKRTAEQTKLCNNSSLLFNLDANLPKKSPPEDSKPCNNSSLLFDLESEPRKPSLETSKSSCINNLPFDIKNDLKKTNFSVVKPCDNSSLLFGLNNDESSSRLHDIKKPVKPCDNSSLLFHSVDEHTQNIKPCEDRSLLNNIESDVTTKKFVLPKLSDNRNIKCTESKLCDNSSSLFNFDYDTKKSGKVCENSSLLYNIEGNTKKPSEQPKLCDDSSLLFNLNDCESKLCNNSSLLFNFDNDTKKSVKLYEGSSLFFNVEDNSKASPEQPKLCDNSSLLFSLNSSESKLCENSSLLFNFDDTKKSIKLCENSSLLFDSNPKKSQELPKFSGDCSLLFNEVSQPAPEAQSKKRRRKKKRKDVSEGKMDSENAKNEADDFLDEAFDDANPKKRDEKSYLSSSSCEQTTLTSYISPNLRSLSLLSDIEIKESENSSCFDCNALEGSGTGEGESLEPPSSSDSTPPSVPTEESQGDRSTSEVEDEYEWEKLLDEEFQEFDFKTSSKKDESDKSPKANLESGKESTDSSIIEIYGFPEEFKTQDIMMSFLAFANRGFKLKWVDNTHALGVFPTPALAEEALNSGLPFVKTRPLCEASQASKDKADRLTLPPALRPKTCAALARRLVSGALGVRAVFTKEEREAEREMLKEAREQKRLAAKQRDAAWEGKF